MKDQERFTRFPMLEFDKKVYAFGHRFRRGQVLDVGGGLEDSAWKFIAPSSFEASELAAAVSEDFILVTGGPFTYRYDPKLDQWKSLGRMKQRRSRHGMVALDGEMFLVIGGDFGCSMERYNVAQDKWTMEESLLARCLPSDSLVTARKDWTIIAI